MIRSVLLLFALFLAACANHEATQGSAPSYEKLRGEKRIRGRLNALNAQLKNGQISQSTYEARSQQLWAEAFSTDSSLAKKTAPPDRMALVRELQKQQRAAQMSAGLFALSNMMAQQQQNAQYTRSMNASLEMQRKQAMLSTFNRSRPEIQETSTRRSGVITAQQVGDTLYRSDGVRVQKIGNIYWGSNGATATRTGDTIWHSDGTTSRKVGNTWHNSNGGSTTTIGSTIYFNEP
jgi:hypothetical protein